MKIHSAKRITQQTVILGLALLVNLIVATNSVAQNHLDPSFGNGGIVISPFTPSSDKIHSIQVQPDGKIIVSGYSYEYDFFVEGETLVSGFIARYNSSGTLDASFGSNGKILIGNQNEHVGRKTILQPDGKIVSIGTRYTFNSGIYIGADFTVFRYNANGTSDDSFGMGGKVFTSVQNHSYAGDVVLQPDGKIVVMGFVSGESGGKFGIVRYNADGSLDNSFGTGGKVITDIASSVRGFGWMLLRPDGKMVLGVDFVERNQAGNYIDQSILVRYNPDGSLDPGFGTNGKVIRELPGYSAGFHSVLQPDGKIVVTGRTPFDYRITRFNENGSIDTGFADNGIFRAGFGNSIALQTDGKIITVGDASYGFAALRLNPNGSPDTSFGTNGKLITTVGTNGISYAMAVALQPDGNILAGGVADASDGIGDAAIVRYLGDSSTTRRTQYDFDGDGKTDEAVFRPSDNVWYLNRSQAGFTAYQFGAAGDLITPADFTGDGKTDVAVFRPSTGNWFMLRSEDNTFSAAQFGSSGDIPSPGDYDGDGKADYAVFRPSTGYWYLLRSTAGFSAVSFGIDGDVPTLGDFEGDGKVDVAVFRPSNGTWYRLNSSNGSFAATQFGITSDKVVPADYTGDGKTDLAVFRPADSTWYIMRSEDNSFYAVQFGVNGDLPSPGDYDGDGKADPAVFRPSSGVWYEQRSTSGFAAVQFGTNGDKPGPNAFVY